MFFKTDKNIDNRAVMIGYFATFVFWGLILLVNSFYESFYEREFISSSLTILLMGLAVFFLTEIIATKIRKKQSDKLA